MVVELVKRNAGYSNYWVSHCNYNYYYDDASRLDLLLYPSMYACMRSIDVTI
jgi:hypothetical protein